MKLKKCLIAFLIGFSLLFSGALISCGDTPASNENEQNNELSENNSENETENKTDKDKESDANKDKDSDKDTSKDTSTDSSTNTDTTTDNSTNPTPTPNTNTDNSSSDTGNTETTQSVTVSLSQESVTETITFAGLTFTAPEGYESYDWMIFGSTFSERQINHIETTTNVWTPDADFVTTYGNLFDVGATYVVYVSAMKMVNGESVIDMFKITFVYGED